MKSLARPSREARKRHNKERRTFQRELMRLQALSARGEDLDREIVMRLSSASRGSHFSAASSGLGDGVDPGRADVGDGDSDENDVTLTRTYAGASYADAVVAERRREIGEVHGKMGKVRDVFNDLANLVDEQQVEIDDIEQNILMSREAAGRGMGQLEKGSELQRKSGKCVRWLLAVVLLAALICIGLLYGPQMWDAIFGKKN